MSPRRTWAVARLDLLHNLRRPLFWIWIAVVLLMAWSFSTGNARIQSGDSDVGGTKAFLNSEFALAQIFSVVVLMIGSFFIAVAAGMVVLHDEELQVGGLLHSTRLSPREYVWGKFLAVIVSCLAVLAIQVAGTAFFYHVLTGAEEAEFIGPFVLANYLRPTLFMALPTVLFLAGLTFWIGERFRRPILVFFLPVACLLACVFFIWNTSPNWVPTWAQTTLEYIDPAGYRWLSETYLLEDRGVSFYNHQPIAYDTDFLISRALLALLGLVGVIAAAAHFGRTLRGTSKVPVRRASLFSRIRGSEAVPSESASSRRSAIPATLRTLNMSARRPGFLSGLVTITRVEFRELRSSPGLYLFVPLIVLETVMNALFLPGVFETEVLMTGGILAVRGVNFLSSMVCLLLLFYTVESLRREEGTGLSQIFSSTPVRTASILFGKALANSLVGVVAIGVTMITSLAVLAVQGHVPLAAWPFVLVWCLVLLPTFLLWCSFTGLIYSIVRSRYTTYALALAAMIWTGREYWGGDLNWVWNWPLWGTLQWSDMGTFELLRTELVMNRVVALLLTLLFTVLTVRLFPRRQFDATNTLLRLRPLPLLKRALFLSPVLIPPIVLGLLLNSRIAAGWQGEAMDKATKDYWRKNVRTWTDSAIPDIAMADVELDLYPERRGFECKGSFTLVNNNVDALDVIPITRGFHWRRPDSLPPDEDESEDPLWTLDGEPCEPIDAAGLMLFPLPAPLRRGESVEIGFHHSGEVPAGASENGGGSSEFILPSGIVLTSFRPTFVPSVGYRDGIGVDEDNRSDTKEFADDHYEGETRGLFGGSWTDYHVRMKVSAPEEFTINCIGIKTSDEVAAGRRTVAWETDTPVRFFNVVAGRWNVIRGELDTAIYYHAGHDYNVEAMIEALDGARRWYSEWFYPYPWKELKISEFPALAGYAQGFATNIPFSEAIGFLTKGDEEEADAPFLVTAHETAHQWWGNILVPGEGPGANLLSEGMAHFSTLLLFEQMRGLRGRIAFARKIEEQYGERRTGDSERPLVKIDGSRPGDTTVTYDKAGWVFWMLLDHMGRENALQGIQSFIRHYRTDRDHPVLQDFLAHMRPFAPDVEAYDAFTRQWFFEVVVPEYELHDVLADGDAEAGWSVTLTVENIGTGVMPIEVCASTGERFPDEDDAPEDERDAEPPDSDAVLAAESETDPATESAAADHSDGAYRELRTTITLGAGESAQVVLECPFEPERVVLDPDARVLMLRRRRAQQEL